MLRVNDFDTVARTPLDEWVKFLKTGEIDRTATAKGLPEARERLRWMPCRSMKNVLITGIWKLYVIKKASLKLVG